MKRQCEVSLPLGAITVWPQETMDKPPNLSGLHFLMWEREGKNRSSLTGPVLESVGLVFKALGECYLSVSYFL
jgi:hypothetical protein